MPPKPARTSLCLLAAAALLVTLASCSSSSDGGGSAGPGSSTTAAADRLPPATLAGLVAVFDPLVAPLGLRLTRGAVVPKEGGSSHLALYVEPLDTWDNDRFVATIAPLARLVTPLVFARWSGLASYDICQEPSPAVDDRPEAPPITQLDVTRAYSDSVDWNRATLASIVGDIEGQKPGVTLYTSGALSPLVRAAAHNG